MHKWRNNSQNVFEVATENDVAVPQQLNTG
jgi:hypothetical protein